MGIVEMIRLADEPWAPVAQGHPGAEVVRSVRVALRGTNVWIQRAALKKRVAENTRYRRFAAIHC